VLDTEPRQPRLLNPKVDRDLATICLKCLDKDQQRRYSSALALAEDLERWLEHEPIRGRRTGLFTRGRKWVLRNPTTAVPEIARQLGVAHILEGSVQKSGDTVRINVQLIKAANDSHLWADTYDRRLTDIFSVESEVAKAIADQLRAKLTSHEEQVMAAKPTDNPEAYDAYLRVLALVRGGSNNADTLAAQKYLREAVRLDPKFALSWALLSWFDAAAYRATSLPPTPALREEARQSAETALTLQPNLGEAILAKGEYY